VKSWIIVRIYCRLSTAIQNTTFTQWILIDFIFSLWFIFLHFYTFKSTRSIIHQSLNEIIGKFHKVGQSPFAYYLTIISRVDGSFKVWRGPPGVDPISGSPGWYGLGVKDDGNKEGAEGGGVGEPFPQTLSEVDQLLPSWRTTAPQKHSH
jgi:hypothetical protein